MVLIKEFRIVMPVTLEEYEVALLYTIMKMEQQTTTSTEGVEFLESMCFEDDLLGKGQYTSKLYHLQSKLPTWIKALAPASALTLKEESWNAYPKAKTVIQCPYFNQCLLTIDTINKADNGCSENVRLKELKNTKRHVHGLSDELLAARKVEIIDIASPGKDYWSKIIGSKKIDLSKFKPKRTGRGPLLKGWQDECKPVMTTYKLVMMNAPIWGFGNRLEEAVLAGERALFLESHRLCFALIDEWYGMNMAQINEMEKENDLLLKKRLQRANLRSEKVEFQ